MKKEHAGDIFELQDLYILGYELTDPQETFNYSISSKEVGIVVGSTFLQSKLIFSIKFVEYKCVFLRINNKLCIILLLHT